MSLSQALNQFAQNLGRYRMGLADIESRVRALGGTAVCGPYEDGWRVFVSVPKKRWTMESRD